MVTSSDQVSEREKHFRHQKTILITSGCHKRAFSQHACVPVPYTLPCPALACPPPSARCQIPRKSQQQAGSALIKTMPKTPRNGIAGRHGEFLNGPSLAIWLSKHGWQHHTILSFPGHVSQHGRTHSRTKTTTATRNSISNSFFLVLWV